MAVAAAEVPREQEARHMVVPAEEAGYSLLVAQEEIVQIHRFQRWGHLGYWGGGRRQIV